MDDKALSVDMPRRTTRPRSLEGCSPRWATAARPTEVIVVCDGCTDNTATVPRSFPDVVVEEPRAGKPAALNAEDLVASLFTGPMSTPTSWSPRRHCGRSSPPWSTG
jgi:hypothetical protein